MDYYASDNTHAVLYPSPLRRAPLLKGAVPPTVADMGHNLQKDRKELHKVLLQCAKHPHGASPLFRGDAQRAEGYKDLCSLKLLGKLQFTPKSFAADFTALLLLLAVSDERLAI